MKTDGYVKVDGEELAELLKPGLEKLKYLSDWYEAKCLDHYFNIKKRREKLDKMYRLELDYAKSADIHYHVKEAKEYATNESIGKNWFARIFKRPNPSVYFDCLKSYLKELKPSFWSDYYLERLEIYKYDSEKFVDSGVVSLGNTGYYGYGLMRPRPGREFNSYLEMKEFSQLTGEVFININDYNQVQLLINNPEKFFTNLANED